jgi:hypothetical protein
VDQHRQVRGVGLMVPHLFNKPPSALLTSETDLLTAVRLGSYLSSSPVA